MKVAERLMKRYGDTGLEKIDDCECNREELNRISNEDCAGREHAFEIWSPGTEGAG
jgi:hypothetical protein